MGYPSPGQGTSRALTSAAPRSSSSPGTWLSIKSICSGSPSPARPGHVSEPAGGLPGPPHPRLLDTLPRSPGPSSLWCLGPRGSRANSEIRKDSSEKSSVDFKAETGHGLSAGLRPYGVPHRGRGRASLLGREGGGASYRGFSQGPQCRVPPAVTPRGPHLVS